MTLADIAHVALAEALAADAHPVTLTVRPCRIDLVVRDHRVIVEIRRGILRVVWVVLPVGMEQATSDERVALDDADTGVVGAMVRRAVDAGLTPF